LYIPCVKDEKINIKYLLKSNNVAPPNFALGLGIGISEVDEEVSDLIIDYDRHINMNSIFNSIFNW
jgi:hypothetical protein